MRTPPADAPLEITDQRDHLPVFIDREIDDSGLDVYAVRVYLTLSRRAGLNGQAFESVPNMAARVGMSERRAREALRDLEAAGVIAGEPRVGETTVYRLTGKSAWSLPAPRREVPPPPTPAPGAATPAPDAGVPRHEVPPTPAPGAAKGFPSKGSPSKGSPSTSTASELEPAIAEPTVDEDAEVRQVELETMTANDRRRARSYSTGLLAQQHPAAHAGLQDLQSVYGWPGAQYQVIAAKVLELARDHGGERVGAAISAVLLSGEKIKQPLAYVAKILSASPSSEASAVRDGRTQASIDLEEIFGLGGRS